MRRTQIATPAMKPLFIQRPALVIVRHCVTDVTTRYQECRLPNSRSGHFLRASRPTLLPLDDRLRLHLMGLED
jgi:hypothetical protein